MFTNIVALDSKFLRNEQNSLKSVYKKFHSVMDQGIKIINQNENMSSSRVSTIASDESFITPVSSMGDLMTLSPQKTKETDITSDLLTGAEFDSICDVTMQEIPMYDDMFIDGNSIDYLAKCADSHKNLNFVDRGKESLFVKFDPLYAANKLHNIDLGQKETESDVGYETSSTSSFFTDNVSGTPKPTLSTGSVLSKGAKDKPTQVVPPVVSNDAQKTSSTQVKPTPLLIRSVSAILTPTQVSTERLISFSTNSPPVAAPRSPRNKNFSTHEVDRLQSLRNILQNQDREVLQLRQENRELKSSLQDVEHNFSRSKEEYETKIEKLIKERDILQTNECKLKQQINAKTISNKQMCIVMEEYEKTISAVISEQQKEKIQNQELFEKVSLERDQALMHLASMESSFNDLLAKYEKCKLVIMEAKEREKVLTDKISEYEQGIEKYKELYDKLKQVTSENLEKANETLENIRKSHNVEITKLNAIIKKHEIMISSLQESLAQKTRDNEELTRICDQLINDVR